MDSVASVLRSSLEIIGSNPYAGTDINLEETSHDNNPSVAERLSLNESLDFSADPATNSIEEELVPVSVPYAEVSDFGRCAFPAGAEAVISDYFSGPSVSNYDVEEEYAREFCMVQQSEVTDNISASFEANEVSEQSSCPGSSKQNTKTAAKRTEKDLRREFFSSNCCTWRCYKLYYRDIIVSARETAIENDYYCSDHVNHLHMTILGQQSALTAFSTPVTTSLKEVKERERPKTRFHFKGYEVCQKLWSFVNCCTDHRQRDLTKQLKDAGMSPKVHGRQGPIPHNVTSIEKIEEFKTFLFNFCEVHALVLPGRTPYHNATDTDLKVLPSSMTKTAIYKSYKSSCEAPISLSSFVRLWSDLFPNIVVQKPRTDLCSECYSFTISLGKLHGLSDRAKSALLEKAQFHLSRVDIERKEYKKSTEKLAVTRSLGNTGPCTFTGSMHYSFDYAQQVFLPYDSQQVGPLYFLTPYKVALFGVACEPLGKFVLYLIPESAFGAGKGSNTVISLFHHFLENFGLGEENLNIQADNCAGQNKNNFLLQYAAWRVSCGLHKNFKISFLPVGHTNLPPTYFSA